MKKKTLVIASLCGVVVIGLIVALLVAGLKPNTDTPSHESSETTLEIEETKSDETVESTPETESSIESAEGSVETSETEESAETSTDESVEETKESEAEVENAATPAPTSKPTEKPTAEPTAKPTEKPVVTTKPTEAPTQQPTPAPTPDPTPEPTPDPTPAPTPQPTPEPTPDPTPAPTAPPHDHVWTEYWWSVPTCGAHGDVTVYCILCNEVDESRTGRVEPLGHTLVGRVFDEGDCVSPSATEYYCSVCGAENVVPFSYSSGPGRPDAHNWAPAKKQVFDEELFEFVEIDIVQCTRCGKNQ